jgi:hypothetical protein
MEKIVVLGGTGFLGSSIVRRARSMGFKVISISRNPKVMDEENISYDIFSSPTPQLLESIKNTSHCIHSLGTIFNNEDYKSIIKGIPRIPNESLHDNNLFRKLNTESLHIFVDLLKEMNPALKSFSFISVDKNILPFPFNHMVDSRYFSSKMEAEKYLMNQSFNFQRLVFRPGFMYSDSNAITLSIAASLSTMNCIKTSLPIRNILPPPPAKPLHVLEVTDFILNCIMRGEEGNINEKKSFKVFNAEEMTANK